MEKWKIGWGVARECNMRCQFCYSAQARSIDNALKLEDYFRFIDENAQYIDSINYGTGESTLNDNWFSLIKYIRDRYPAIRQSLTTNGYLSERVKDPVLDQIFTEAIDEVDVSLDFADAEKHCTFRGQKHAYTWAMNALEYVKRKGKTLTIVVLGTESTLQKSNLVELFKIADRFNAILRINIYRPTNSDPRINEMFIVSYQTLMTALKYINENHTVLSLSDSLFTAILMNDTQCVDTSGLSSLRILPDGSITPSTYLITEEFKYCSIQQKNILQHISESQVFNDFRGNDLPEACKKCSVKDRCLGGTLDRRYLWFGTLNKPDPYCPFHYGNCIPDFVIKQTDHLNAVSVHDGYLPTMFFKPGK